MFIQTTITWTDDKYGLSIPAGTTPTAIVNCYKMSDITTKGVGSRFSFTLFDDPRAGEVWAECTSTVAEIIAAIDTVPASNVYTASVYPNNNLSRTPTNINIPLAQMSILFSHSNPAVTWCYYDEGGGGIVKKVIINDSLSDIFDNLQGVNGAPSNLVATIQPDGVSAVLTWTNGATNQEGVAIEASEDGVNFFETFYYYGVDIATCTQIGLVGTRDYYYRAYSFRGSSHSSYSNMVSVLGADLFSTYWLTRYISNLGVLSDSDTQQTLTATIVGAGYGGVSFEYSTDGVTYTEHGTSANGTYIATGLTTYTLYYWRARLYKGTNYSNYSDVSVARTDAPLADGNTVARFVYDDMATLTKDGSEQISAWNDKSGNDNHLSNAGADNTKPVWLVDGVDFDGSNDIIKTGSFSYPRPAFIYFVFKPNTFENTDVLIDGVTANTIQIFQFVPTPNIYIGDGVSFAGPNINAVLGSWAILRGLYNGASSKIQINETTVVTGNLTGGDKDAGGITIGGFPNNTRFGDFTVKEVIFRDIVDSVADESAIYNYLKAKYFYTTNSSGDNRFFVPHNFNADSKVILYAHGSGEDEDSVFTDYRKLLTIHTFLGQGWGVISALAGGNNWGNQDSLDKYNALITWAKTIVPFTDISIYAQSMGGLSGMQLFMADAQYDKFIGIYPCLSLANMFTTAYKDNIKTAFSFADDADYATATAGHDPLLLSGALLGNRKIQLVASSDDVTVTKADNTDAFNTAFGSLADITVVVATGVHGDLSHFDPERDVAFLNS